jgi:hypothetical protein
MILSLLSFILNILMSQLFFIIQINCNQPPVMGTCLSLGKNIVQWIKNGNRESNRKSIFLLYFEPSEPYKIRFLI